MKLKHANIRHFKGVDDLDIDFTSALHPEGRSLTCLIGDNGSGKTTVLQAIALTLSLATRKTDRASNLNWHGFLADRVSSRGPTRVELTVSMDADEVALTRDLYEEWRVATKQEWRDARLMTAPGDYREVTLVFDEKGRVDSPQGLAGKNQLLGRYLVKALVAMQPNKRQLFRRLGDVFWFDQFRNLGSMLWKRNGEEKRNHRGGWQAGVEQLREFLVGWWGYHTSPARIAGGRDYLVELEKCFGEVFPGTVFRGVAPRENVTAPRPSDFFFLLEREGKVYDLAEMSSGEQAVFPLVYEFVRLDIAKSVVLIDELDLNLHPSQQQALLGALRRIGPDCQFIITTHSPFLTEVIPPEQEVRLKGGLACL